MITPSSLIPMEDLLSSLEIEDHIQSLQIQEVAVEVSLHIGRWKGTKVDKKATASVLKQYEAEEDTGRFTKVLLPKEAIATLAAIEGKLRATHLRYTIPWRDGGGRLLASKLLMDYLQDMKSLVRDFSVETQKLIQNFSTYVEQQKLALGQLFNPLDYPSASELSRKHYVNIEIDPVPDFNRLRSLRVDPKTADCVYTIGQKTFSSRMGAAHLHLWKTIREILQTIKNSVETEDHRFHKSVLENLKNTLQIYASYGEVLNDAEFLQVKSFIESEIINLFDPKELVFSGNDREDVLNARSDLCVASINALNKIDDALKKLGFKSES